MGVSLREFVRACLAEAATTVAGASAEGLCLSVKKTLSGGSMSFALYDPKPLLTALDGIEVPKERQEWPDQGPARSSLSAALNAGILAMISVVRTPSDECKGAWEVQASAAKKGYGPTIYSIAMAVVPGGKIMADTLSTSPSARKVWNHFRSEGFGTDTPVDAIRLGTGCRQRDNDDSSPLAYAYQPVGQIDVSGLIRSHQRVVGEVEKRLDNLGLDEIEFDGLIRVASANFFDTRYSEANT